MYGRLYERVDKMNELMASMKQPYRYSVCTSTREEHWSTLVKVVVRDSTFDPLSLRVPVTRWTDEDDAIATLDEMRAGFTPA